MDWNHHFAARGDRRDQVVRVHAPSVWLHINKDRSGTAIFHSAGGGHPSGFGNQHLVPGSHAQRQQCQMKRPGAGTGRHIEPGVGHLAKSALKPLKVKIPILVPSMSASISYIIHLQFGDGRACGENRFQFLAAHGCLLQGVLVAGVFRLPGPIGCQPESPAHPDSPPRFPNRPNAPGTKPRFPQEPRQRSNAGPNLAFP